MNKISFRYNGRNYNPKNPEKKLKQLGITWDDVEIIELQEKEEIIEYEDIKLYYFINPKTKETISSIYPTLEGLGKYGEGFLPTRTVEDLHKLFNEELKEYERSFKENTENDRNQAR